MLAEVQFYPPRGIYKIKQITPRKGSLDELAQDRIGRHVIFPFDIERGICLKVFYVNYNCVDTKFAGKMLMTTNVESIQVLGDEIQVSTRNSQYLFERKE